jgi:SpoVK/Ycf46/Vps4 family AAA+-type ATPase
VALPPSGTTVQPDAGAIIFKHSKGSDYKINDQQAVITPITVPGYSLEDKCWMEFDVEKLQEIEWEENCLLKLEVDPLIRDTLDVLVKQHTALSEGFKDVVAGKGQGLTVLLHGPPGSGKTLTAGMCSLPCRECVANATSEVISEHSQKPLLRITSGDLGTEPGAAEKKLQEYFTLAHAWKAILLLDEADVFLSRRTTGDIVRNAFITVFLRSMEYYAGIMLLTTNQKEAFDEAFQSRIHLQIPYLPANHAQRKAIWANIVAAQKVEHNLDEAAFERLATTYKRNGREIKNMVLLALMISKGKGVVLGEDTIDAVGKMDSRSEGEFALSRSNTVV